MRCNVGWVEQVVRFLIGLPTAVSYLYVRHFHPLLSVVLLCTGAALILTAIFARCPVHHVLGTSSLPRSDEMLPAQTPK